MSYYVVLLVSHEVSSAGWSYKDDNFAYALMIVLFLGGELLFISEI